MGTERKGGIQGESQEVLRKENKGRREERQLSRVCLQETSGLELPRSSVSTHITRLTRPLHASSLPQTFSWTCAQNLQQMPGAPVDSLPASSGARNQLYALSG